MTDLKQDSEELLVRRCRSGEPAAQRELYDRYAGRLLGLCMRYVADRSVAEDLLHDGFLKIFGAFGRFEWRGAGSLRAWMERITVNVVLEYLRSRKRAGIVVSDDRLPDEGAEPDESDVEQVPSAVLQRFIAELPDGYRTVFNLYCIEGFSHREIAAVLGINEKSSSSQLFRAKTILARKIKEYINKVY